MFKISLLCAIIALSLGACTVSPGRGSKVVLSDGTTIQSGTSNGNFCPPGQAKKGNC